MKISRLHSAVIVLALFTACTHDAVVEDAFAAPSIIAAYEDDTDLNERKSDKDSDPDLEVPETENEEHDDADMTAIDTSDSAEIDDEIDQKKKDAAADPELEETEIPVPEM